MIGQAWNAVGVVVVVVGLASVGLLGIMLVRDCVERIGTAARARRRARAFRRAFLVAPAVRLATTEDR